VGGFLKIRFWLVKRQQCIAKASESHRYLLHHYHCLGTLSTDTASQLNVLRHNGDTLGMNSAQVRVLEQADKVCLSSFLKGKNGRSLEAKIALEILSNLTNETLEG
jgi:hypothetical protein